MPRVVNPKDFLPYLPIYLVARGTGKTIEPRNTADDPRGANTTEFNKLPKDEQERQKSLVKAAAPKGVSLTKEAIVRRLIAHHMRYSDPSDPEAAKAYHEGGNFYHEASDLAHAKAHEHNIEPHQAAGVIAAVSPQTEWERNKTQAVHLMDHFRDYDHIKDTDEAAKAYHKSIDENQIIPEGGKKIPRSSLVFTTHAFRIARGEDVDKHLGGHKVRSFYNNIIDPDGTDGRNALTVDRHALSAAVGGSLSKDLVKSLTARTSSTIHNTKGAYAYFADAYREAHKRLLKMSANDPSVPHPGATPAHFQAKIWGAWREEVDQNGKRLNKTLPHYASMSREGGFTIDPMGGPQDEEDPEIAALDSEEDDDHAPHKDMSPAIADPVTEGTGLKTGSAIYFPIVNRHHSALGADEFLFEGADPMHYVSSYHEASDAVPMCQSCGYPAIPLGVYRDGSTGHPLVLCADCAGKTDHLEKEATEGTGMAGNWDMSVDSDSPYPHGGQTPDPKPPADGSEYEDTVGDPSPSPWWQEQHSSGAENPASTAPASFSDTLDPAEYKFMHGLPDEQALKPGPASSGNQITQMTMTTSKKDPLAWLLSSSKPAEGPQSAPKPHAKAGDGDIAKAARAYLATLSVSEQQDLINEGAAEGVRAANFDRLNLENTHYADLEEEFLAAEAGMSD